VVALHPWLDLVGVKKCMTVRTKFWLKIVMTVLFVAVEILTFSHSVAPAFEQPSVSHALRACGTQISFFIALLFLWFGERTRVSQESGWGGLAMAGLIFGLI
jgi:hypothetical protein